jgi:DNA-binding response OmpR family regulator
MNTVLIVTQDEKKASSLRKCLGEEEYVFDTAGDRESGLAKFIEQQSSILFIDLTILAPPGRQNPKIDYTKAFQPFRNVFPLAPIIVVSLKTTSASCPSTRCYAMM